MEKVNREIKNKAYLGDAVYVENDGFGLLLTTEDGTRVTNEIYLEPSVYNALVNYVHECAQRNLKQLDQ